jgi:hypothetical protein
MFPDFETALLIKGDLGGSQRVLRGIYRIPRANERWSIIAENELMKP